MCTIPPRSLKDFTIAQVIEATPHPNADRLRVCMVDTGAGAPVQVVCGAPNARTGLKTVFAAPGTYIPAKKITLGKGVIRGVESLGMLCSASELELPGDHDGIIELPEDAPVGAVYAQWAGLDDPVIEINLTPNRPDAAGVPGVARDLAAAGLGVSEDTGRSRPFAGGFPCPVGVTLDFAARRRASRAALRAASRARRQEWTEPRVAAGAPARDRPAPDQRARRHHQFSDLRPRAAAACLRREEGQGRSRRAPRPRRRGAAGARRQDLWARRGHGRHRRRQWASNRSPASWAARPRAATTTTTDVLIESALWDPHNIAQTGRKLGIVTDARYRFERGVDPAFALPGLELATKLVLELCGGEASNDRRRRRGADARRASCDFPWSETKRLTGLDISPDGGDRDPRRVSALRSRSRGRGPRENHRAELAAGYRGQGRYCRGDRAHPRRRQYRLDAARRAPRASRARC